MSINFPEFNHVAEYARYGGIKASLLKKRVAPMYPGELQVIVWPDEATGLPIHSQYHPKVRGFLYHHGFRVLDGNKKTLTGQHLLSLNAFKKLTSIVGSNAQIIPEIYRILVQIMNHDMLHGFNGDGKNFAQFDEQLVFGGVEFFPLMGHSDVVERWLQRDSNGDSLLNMGRYYMVILKPLADEYEKTKDPELLKLLDYFVLIYQKSLLTFLPLKHEISLKFNGGANRLLYASLPPCEVTRDKCDSIMNLGLSKANVKNNTTISANSAYDRKTTGAACAGVDFLDNQFEGKPADSLLHIFRITIQNLIMGGCFRMVPNMDRPADLQKSFHDIYIK